MLTPHVCEKAFFMQRSIVANCGFWDASFIEPVYFMITIRNQQLAIISFS